MISEDEIFWEQTRRYNEQLDVMEEEAKRYNVLLDKWEEQTKRVDVLLDRVEALIEKHGKTQKPPGE